MITVHCSGNITEDRSFVLFHSWIARQKATIFFSEIEAKSGIVINFRCVFCKPLTNFVSFFQASGPVSQQATGVQSQSAKILNQNQKSYTYQVTHDKIT